MGRISSKRNNNNGRKFKFPGPYSSQCILTRKMRYSVGSDISEDPITVGALRAMLIAKSTTGSTTDCFLPIQAVRLRSVEMFGVDNQQGEIFNSVSLIWNGLNAPVNEIVGTGNNTSPAYIKAIPPPNSQCSWWHDQSSTQTQTLFSLTAQSGAIVDVVIDFVLHDGASADLAVLTNATVGPALWTAYLDCLSTSNTTGQNQLAPVGLSFALLASI